MFVDASGVGKVECPRVPIGSQLSFRLDWLAGDVAIAESRYRFGPFEEDTTLAMTFGNFGSECDRPYFSDASCGPTMRPSNCP